MFFLKYSYIINAQIPRNKRIDAYTHSPDCFLSDKIPTKGQLLITGSQYVPGTLLEGTHISPDSKTISGLDIIKPISHLTLKKLSDFPS